jgi:molecular chaperone GrpE
MSGSEHESQGPVIRDRRRIDPVTGQPRQSAQASDAPAGQAPRGSGQPRPGKHAASKPGAARQETAAAAPADKADDKDAATEQADRREGGADQSAPPGNADGAKGKSGGPDLAAMLAERTADLQRLQAEYANYRKRVERDRVAVREHALASVVSELLPVLDDIGRAREHEELTGGFKAVAEALESAASKLGLTTFGEAGEPFDPNVHEALMHSYSPDVTEPSCVQILQPGYKVGERILRPARVAVAEPTDPAGARPESGPGEGADGETGGGDEAADDAAGSARDEAK